MSLKTCIKRLLKYLPISTETLTAVANDETIRKDITADAMAIFSEPEQEPVIIDAEVNESNG